MRVGIGFDAHRFSGDRPLVLGTIAIEHDRGLAGHSDGDVLTHAVVDAILGAAGLGDIGTHFPSSDARWEGADSAIFLERAVAGARESGLLVASVDATVICEAPRLDGYREKIRASLSTLTGTAAVGVKGTTSDTMGFTGRGEGIAAIAVALLRPA
jgi:2-C-methyl-D-erythritol 4-phosphate cytidylyltransferase/2-C-methyl-D-erythritol 2,4-cyclodiphosphate synthase